MARSNTTPSRNFIGYADELPHANWPGGARVAVNFCINYEEGGERCVLAGDSQSEVRLSDVAVDPKIGRRDLNIEQQRRFPESEWHQIARDAVGILVIRPSPGIAENLRAVRRMYGNTHAATLASLRAVSKPEDPDKLGRQPAIK